MVWTSAQLTTRGVSSEFHAIIAGEEQTTPQICLPLLLPSKCSCHITITIVLCTCQLIAVQEDIHHSKQCLGRSETDISLIVPHTKCMLWLPTTEAHDTSWTEASISMQRTQNLQILTMRAPTALMLQLP